MTFITAYIAILLVFGLIDALWLMTMADRLYRPVLGSVLADEVRLAPAVAFYLMYPIGLVVFAVLPALRDGSVVTAMALAFLFGGLAYATYDLTNYATLKNWTLQITIIDIVYGAVTAAVCAAVAFYVTRAFA